MCHQVEWDEQCWDCYVRKTFPSPRCLALCKEAERRTGRRQPKRLLPFLHFSGGKRCSRRESRGPTKAYLELYAERGSADASAFFGTNRPCRGLFSQMSNIDAAGARDV